MGNDNKSLKKISDLVMKIHFAIDFRGQNRMQLTEWRRKGKQNVRKNS